VRALLDTQALLWFILGDSSISDETRAIIETRSNLILVSAASAWEIATKVRIGKLPGAAFVAQDFESHLERFHFEQMPISVDHAIRSGLLPGHHKDPFDRMLAAQCQAESIPIISNDKIFDLYGVRRIW